MDWQARAGWREKGSRRQKTKLIGTVGLTAFVLFQCMQPDSYYAVHLLLFQCSGQETKQYVPSFLPSLCRTYLLSTVQFAVFLKLNFCGQTAENTVVFFI
jgi:hypothetical protein